MEKMEILKELYPEDLYKYSSNLSLEEVLILKQLREVIDKEVRPVINDYWERGEFPFAEFKKIAEIGIMNHPDLFKNRENKYKPTELYNLFRYFELARLDASIATFFTVHGGLCYNTILLGGSQKQIEYYAPKISSFEWQGCFALTEPEHGSDIAGGLSTSAQKNGDTWIINGEKRWIGGAATADIIPVFARDTSDNKIKCFMIPGNTEGIKVEKIEGKIALREVQNGHIYLNNVKVSDEVRLENINGFKDVSRILRATRADIAHLATGMIAGSLEAALSYVKDRDQFGKKVAAFQLVQEKLAIMQANLVACLGYSVRLAELQEKDEFIEENSALAKMHNALRLRETVALGREIVGGNGITLETNVARFFADAEAIYSYEGTHEINALIVGRYLTGIGSFV